MATVLVGVQALFKIAPALADINLFFVLVLMHPRTLSCEWRISSALFFLPTVPLPRMYSFEFYILLNLLHCSPSSAALLPQL